MDSVQVAVRVRPLVQHELECGCRSCVEVVPEVQQIITKTRNDKFTFNYVFDSSTPQIDVYETAVQRLVHQLFKGYNVTVLAYGQTGSGKTYSMGTCPSSNPADEGIIQRAVGDMFNRIENDDDWMFNVSVSFLELYNEQLIDLLNVNKNNTVDLRESNREIVIPGLIHKTTSSAQDVLQCLRQGSENRTTGVTAMNAQSSRSHAIFTLYIKQTSRFDEDDSMSAKFHLVDLAGSERSKKTKTEGKRFIEGVNINKELFVLGNVISSLCDGATFINYRNSKLTRLLQDSLGGNALTLMLACVSPADSNLDETVNTLRYADRARKIKNKPVVNQDPQKQEINRLKQTIGHLRHQIVLKQIGTSCPPEHGELLEQNKILLEKIKKLGTSLDRALLKTTSLLERTQIAEAARDRLTAILNNVNMTFNKILTGLDSSGTEDKKTNLQSLKVLMDELKAENEKNETERFKLHEQLCASNTSLNETGLRADLPTASEEDEDDESREEFVRQQAKLHREIQELDKDVAWKEALAVKLAQNNSVEGNLLKATNGEDITELKAQINSLIHEKEELEKQLNNQRSANIDHKLAEQRQKRVKELEDKITALHKKVVEQDRIIKMKERNEEKITSLNREIMSMKQMKVRLINQIKSEGENYRQWRATREQEVCKLRQQNRQKETKFVKMESYYMKQQNVYKRKLEESAAVIKKLKDTLALQQRNAKDKKTLQGNAEKVNQWVNQEFSAMVNALEAERTLENLKKDRALLSKEQNSLKKSLTVPGLKEEEKSKMSEEIKALNEDIELRSTQILDLTHKLQSLDCYQENKFKARYECVQTMGEAKTALRYVFETAHNYLTELHKNKATKDAALQDNYEALQTQLAEKEEMLREEIDKHKETESSLNEKVIMLLKRLQDMETANRLADDSRAPLVDLTNTPEDDAASGSVKDKLMIKQLQQRVEELERLQEKQKEKKKETRETKRSDWNAVITPETRKKFEEEDGKVDLDNSTTDPDWKKTPIYSRIRNMREKMKSDRKHTVDLDDSTTDPDWKKTPIYGRIRNMREEMKSDRKHTKEISAVKRNIYGQPCCSCKRDCTSKACGCRNSNRYCTGSCACDDAICKNKVQHPSSSTMNTRDDSPSDDSDISFKKPRVIAM